MKSTNANPTVAQFKTYVKINHGMQAYQRYFQLQIRAVNAGDDSVKVKSLLPLIQENSELWDMEDKEVPRRVGYQLVIKAEGGDESYAGSFKNIIPDNGRLGFKA